MKSFDVDFRIGGLMESVMEDKDGNEYTEEGKFIEIKPTERIKWEFRSSLQPAMKILMDEFFEDYMDKTKHTVTANFEKEEDATKAINLGWDKMFIGYLEDFVDFINKTLEEQKVTK